MLLSAISLQWITYQWIQRSIQNMQLVSLQLIFLFSDKCFSTVRPIVLANLCLEVFLRMSFKSRMKKASLSMVTRNNQLKLGSFQHQVLNDEIFLLTFLKILNPMLSIAGDMLITINIPFVKKSKNPVKSWKVLHLANITEYSIHFGEHK